MKWAIKITESNLPDVLKYRNHGELVDDRTKEWIGKYMSERKYFSAKKPSHYPIVTEIPKK